ncbi:MAG: hypothetical protein PWP62_1560 [Eubacteriaceae bacterium]|nr:hypothetical protein [Eubacteriaceae bacterium]
MILEEKEKISYIQTLMYMVSADGKITAEETEMFYSIARNNNMSDELIEQNLKEIIDGKRISDIVIDIEQRNTKLMLLYELILICYIDRDYTEIERETVEEIAQLMKIETKKIHELESIINESQELQNKLEIALEVK